MREIIYLNQEEIDEMVQSMGPSDGLSFILYNSFRALQDEEISRVTTPFKIYIRKDAE